MTCEEKYGVPTLESKKSRRLVLLHDHELQNNGEQTQNLHTSIYYDRQAVEDPKSHEYISVSEDHQCHRNLVPKGR